MTPLAIAHKALKGNLSNSYDYDIDNDRFLYLCNDDDYCTFSCKNNACCLAYISTVEEFINFKGEGMEVLVNTIEGNGKLYQIGCFYEFKDSISKFWEVGVLCDYDNGKFQSKCGNKLEWYDSIKQCTGIMGTVADAPVTLTDGKAYQFELNGFVWLGFYDSDRNLFADRNILGNKICGKGEPTSIKPLKV
jgi:hypothetical protein